MCTDMVEMIDAVFEEPAADQDSPVAEYRDAQRDYFQAINAVVSTITAGASERQPPAIPDGEALHHAYLEYLGDYITVTGEGAKSIDQAGNSREAVTAAADKVHRDLEVLTSSDFGPDVTDDPTMTAAMDLAPACQSFD